jgi:hypothetical protein
MMAVGITGSSVFRSSGRPRCGSARLVELQEYTVRFEELWAQDQPHRFVVGALLRCHG